MTACIWSVDHAAELPGGGWTLLAVGRLRVTRLYLHGFNGRVRVTSASANCPARSAIEGSSVAGRRGRRHARRLLRTIMTIKRNSACPCGSGRKHRHCCGLGEPDGLATLALAFEAHWNGALRRAATLYRMALRALPDALAAWNMLGVVLARLGRYLEALGYLCAVADRTRWLDDAVLNNLKLARRRMRSERGYPRPGQTAPYPGSGHDTERCAVVVLGMHRSGTSALARILNLCGAYLPERLLPPRQQDNSKGYWEPMSVVQYNQRMLASLGCDWDRPDFDWPPPDDLIDGFVRGLSI